MPTEDLAGHLVRFVRFRGLHGAAANSRLPSERYRPHREGAIVDIALVIIAILALVGGSAALLARQGWLPLALPFFRPSSGGAGAAADLGDGTAIGAGNEPFSLAPMISAQASTPGVPAVPSATVREPIRLDLVPAPSDTASARLERIEGRLDELQRAIARQDHLFSHEVGRMREDLLRRAEAEEARRDAAHERMRADVIAMMARVMVERQSGSSARRMEVSAELYAQLARLEAALATVTNPILLPGEPYAPPAELAPESLVWENWNEVGERAFALAETYSAQRLHLSAQTRTDVGAFVTTMRTLLTRSIYPNLQQDADSGRQAAVRAALAEIAGELPIVRDVLETEYLEGRPG